MQLLSKDQILSKLCVYYHDDFINRSLPEIQKNEEVIWAGNYSFLIKGGMNFFPLPSPVTKQIGYMLTTNCRIIQVYFQEVDKKRECVNIHDDKGMVLLPTYPLTQKEITTRVQFDQKLYTDVPHKNKYEAYNKGHVLKIIGIYFGNELFFMEKEGEEFYQILFEIVHNKSFLNPAISPEQSIPPNFAEQIEKLKELYNYQILNKEEYKSAMKRLGVDIE